MKFFGQPFWSLCGVISRKLQIKSRNQNIFEKFKLNRNLQRISFKMMYNMSMLRHRVSNQRWGGGGGGGGALSHLLLLFCKSVYSCQKHLFMNVFLIFEYRWYSDTCLCRCTPSGMFLECFWIAF